jgi:eukaryotic-like serine/threonine-protein kinase
MYPAQQQPQRMGDNGRNRRRKPIWAGALLLLAVAVVFALTQLFAGCASGKDGAAPGGVVNVPVGSPTAPSVGTATPPSSSGSSGSTPVVPTPTPQLSDLSVYFGGGDGTFYSLNAATGAKRWTYSTGGRATRPVDVNGTVYFGTDSGYVFALRNGQLVWRTSLGADIFGRPAIDDHTIYVGTSGTSSSGAGTNTIFALDVGSGAVRWHYTASSDVNSAIVVASGVVYAASSDGYALALSASEGSPLWKHNIGTTIGPGSVFQTPTTTVADGMVLLGGDDGSVHALNAGSGSVKWSFQAGSGITGKPAFANGIVYAGTQDHTVYALDASSGSKLWSHRLSDVVGTMIVDDGVVYAPSSDGALYALDAGTGAVLWRFIAPDQNSLDCWPASTQGIVFFSCGARVSAVKRDGSQLWAYLAFDALFPATVGT